MRNKKLTKAGFILAFIFLGTLVNYSQDYPVRLTFRDGSTDLFQSDKLGDYINGVNGINCLLVDPLTTTNTAHAGDLSCYTSTRTTRKWCYPTNSAAGGYNGFCSDGQIRVKSVRTVGSTPEYRGVVLRANNKQFSGGIAKFDAEIFNPDPGATDLAYVEKLDECHYRVTMGTNVSGNLFDIYQGSQLTYRSTVPLPFQMIATIIGVKPGCAIS
ncbi:MAG TPA: hypothetical protein VM888_03595 [Chitinophagaceae bacterium]|nr:hypothetical protein [Chitinophagaceae bacterium]